MRSTGESVGLSFRAEYVADLHVPLRAWSRHVELQVRSRYHELASMVLVRHASWLVRVRVDCNLVEAQVAGDTQTEGGIEREFDT